MSAAIDWVDATRQGHLHNDRISYIVKVLGDGTLGGVHFGPRLAPEHDHSHLLVGNAEGGFQDRLGEPLALEYPTAGTGDYRIPGLAVEFADGSSVLHLGYAGHRFESGKPDLPGLPSTYAEAPAEAQTLLLTLRDEPSGLEALLRYTIFSDVPAVARSVRITNTGDEPVRLRSVMSASLDLPDADWDLVHLSGSWSRERHVQTRPLTHGRQSISSRRGSSGHEHNPFLVLTRTTTTEDSGEALAFSLVYSGNFLAETEVDAFGTARVRIGIEPETFTWTLAPTGSFEAPEAVLVYSDGGLSAMSHAYHRLYRERLARGTWRDRPRPVLINNWEATYFDFDEQKLLGIAAAARDLGIELFVLDDGWFGERDDDRTSLGDWTVDRRKLPEGLEGLGRKVEALGMSFGIWIEPEMVSRRSRLFEEHPDWAIGVPGRPMTEGRSQLVLDLARPEVVDHLTRVLSELLSSAPISYVKWDMNRTITEPYSRAVPPERQGEAFHRYILGVYDLYDRLTRAFPDVLFESCAGGGGRFDPVLLAYAPQGWTSDDTDAVERLPIQWGTSFAYPLSAMAAHVSAVPNHQVGRITPLATRAAVAFFGTFGYELDPTALSDEERQQVADQVAFYQRHRDLFQRGRFERLRGPRDGDGNEVAWMVVDDEGSRAIAGVYRILSHRPFYGSSTTRRVARIDRLRLRGLNADATYRIETWPDTPGWLAGQPRNRGVSRGGDELMRAGLVLDTYHDDSATKTDFWARLYILEAV